MEWVHISPTFRNNTIWFILLGITSLATLGFTFYRSKNRGFTIAFFFAVLQLTFYIETLLLAVFNAYSYFPKIAKDSFIDSAMGTTFHNCRFKTGVIHFKEGWFLFVTALDVLGTYFGVAVMDHLFRKNKGLNYCKPE